MIDGQDDYPDEQVTCLWPVEGGSPVVNESL